MGVEYSDKFDAILTTLDEGCADAVSETTRAIEADAKARVPVDTSGLQKSVHVVLSTSKEQYNGHGEAAAAARRVNSGVDILPPLTLDDLSGEGVQQGAVDVAALHGSYIHNGVQGRAPVPFLEESGDGQRAAFKGRAAANLKRLENL